MDYNAEIPFEKKAAAGFFDPNADVHVDGKGSAQGRAAGGGAGRGAGRGGGGGLPQRRYAPRYYDVTYSATMTSLTPLL